MIPVVFGKRFGWLHPGQGVRGVVLCQTFGHEYVWTYSAMRHLADALSARGLWVLRFDYRGTGDSAGADLAPDQFQTAVDDIGAAVAFLKARAGVEHVSLCGFRLGAAFALEAASKHPVDQLALLAPVTSGRTYMRELAITRKTWLDTLQPPLREVQPKTGPLNVLGQSYHDDFARALNHVDLVTRVKHADVSPAHRVLIMHGRTASNDPLRDAFIEKGADVQSSVFDDLTGFIQESAFTVMPHAAFAKAVDWIADDAQGVSSLSAQVQMRDEGDLCIDMTDAIERPVFIGEERLFGVLCEPRGADAIARGPVFLLTNTAASSRVGDSRLAVRIARELARRGIASLRFDARGRGDSPAAPGAVQSDTPYGRIYNLLATQDTATAARWLARQGYRSIFTFGICSGAYHALKAAVVEPAIHGVVAVNIPTFKRPEDKAPDALRRSTRNSMAGYAHSAFDWQKWKAIMRGEKHLLRVLGFVAGYAVTRFRSRIADMLHLDRLSKTPPELAETPMPIMRALDAKGVKTTLLYGTYDAGLDLLASHFGTLGARLSRFANVRVAAYPDLDHSLFNPACLSEVIGVCEVVVSEIDVPISEVAIPERATATL
jgi:alpha-beta hydrolase superfamily lysophospholipase